LDDQEYQNISIDLSGEKKSTFMDIPVRPALYAATTSKAETKASAFI
jgi:hypothetical protein